MARSWVNKIPVCRMILVFSEDYSIPMGTKLDWWILRADTSISFSLHAVCMFLGLLSLISVLSAGWSQWLRSYHSHTAPGGHPEFCLVSISLQVAERRQSGAGDGHCNTLGIFWHQSRSAECSTTHPRQNPSLMQPWSFIGTISNLLSEANVWPKQHILQSEPSKHKPTVAQAPENRTQKVEWLIC